MMTIKLIIRVLAWTMIVVLAVPVCSWAASDLKRGQRTYRQFCSPCHGLQGRGRGTRAKNEFLRPPPRDHTNGFYMNMQPDKRLFNVIKFGGEVHHLAHIMPQWRHILSDPQINQVIIFLRSLADPPYDPPEIKNWDKNPYSFGEQEKGELLDPAQQE
jgi:mono/diheme cytochrome c family protein